MGYVSSSSSDECDKDISSSVRTERPGNFIFKIESFSLLLKALEKSKRDTFDSCHFEAGGYKWKLSVYPNGDKKRGGDGHISLYLALAEPKSLPRGEEVHVMFKLFVFNHLLDNYLVLQDGTERRFHELNTKWGFAKSLSLEIFKDHSQGYLVDDCCVFGVEMFFHRNASKKEGSSLSVKNNLGRRESSFIWKIDKFSTLPEVFESDVFTIEGLKWKLSLYRNGDEKRGGDGYISLYLSLADPKSLPQGEEVHVVFKFFLFDYLGDNYLALKDWRERRFHELNTEWGFAKLLSDEIFKCPSKGYLVDDRCVFGIEMFVHKNSRIGPSASLSMKNSLPASENTFTWKIDKFSTLHKDKVYKSHVFNIGRSNWTLLLYPNGNLTGKGKCISLYLAFYDKSPLPCGCNMYAEYQLSILDQLNQNHHMKTVDGGWFGDTVLTWGLHEFLQLSDLKNASKGFKVNDTVIFEVKIVAISAVNSLP